METIWAINYTSLECIYEIRGSKSGREQKGTVTWKSRREPIRRCSIIRNMRTFRSSLENGIISPRVNRMVGSEEGAQISVFTEFYFCSYVEGFLMAWVCRSTLNYL